MDKILIRKCLEGRATPDEEEAFRAWLSDASSDVTSLQEIMTGSWSSLPLTPVEEDLKEETLTSLRKKLYPGHAKVVPLHSRRPVRWWWYGAAACILVVVAVFTYKGNAPRQEKDVEVAATWKTLVNNDIKVKYAVLPDGSKIWLHPQSTLAYAMPQGGDQRSVRLEGEAFFDIKQDEQRPFRVYTGDIATKVLGTAFNVEAYAKEADIRVSLVQGKVAVGHASAEQVLQAGEMMDYDKTQHAGSKSLLRLRDMDEWTQGNLILNDLPVAYALERLAGRYHLKLQYDKGVNLSDRRVTTIFKKETLHQELDILLFISRCGYTIEGDTLRIIQKSN